MDESMYNLIIVYVEIFLEAKLYNFFDTTINSWNFNHCYWLVSKKRIGLKKSRNFFLFNITNKSSPILNHLSNVI